MANREKDIQVGIIGAGTMGEAFIAALIRSGVPASSVKNAVMHYIRNIQSLLRI
jgi:pyrroline-5-carboxylate reductase